MGLNESEIEQLTVALQIIGRVIDSYDEMPERCKHRFLDGGEIPGRAVELRNVAAKLVAMAIATGRL